MTTSSPVALVTGATRGIGAAIAAGLAARGHSVWAGARSPDRGRGFDGAVRPVALDLDDPASIAAAVATIDAAHGRLDLLVNNAAINLDLGADGPLPLGALEPGDFERTLRTNVVGVYAMTVAALPLLRRASGARIVNLTTGLASMQALADPDSRGATRRLFAYTTSKAAVNALTLLLAHELRAEGVAVNAADPGFVATDMNGHAGVLSAEQGAEPVLRLAAADTTGILAGQDGAAPW
jgi:NAD(P)-dependent dehydrogenase (short-subunit alcohol dehydrogenase family)